MRQDIAGGTPEPLGTLFSLGAVRELTDAQLLGRFAGGPGGDADAAFRAVVERHGPMVLRVCRAVLRDPHDAHDAFQVVFLVLVRRARSLHVRESMAPWLHQVAYRTAVCARAAEARRRRHQAAAARAPGCVHPTGDDPADADAGRALHEEIDRLPERYRVPIVLCDLQGLSCEEAARRMGRPVGTVKGWRSRGRDRLRDRLTRRGLAPAGVGAALAAGPTAPPPPDVVAAAARAGSLLVSGNEAPGTVPASVLDLLGRASTMLAMAQLKRVLGVAVLAGVTAMGVGVLGVRAPAQQRPKGVIPGRPPAEPAAKTLQTRGDAGTQSNAVLYQRPLPTRVYFVGDIIMPRPGGEADPLRPAVDMTPVLDLLKSSVAPGTWGTGTRQNSPAIYPHFLTIGVAVRHTEVVHTQVQERFRQLRRIHRLPDPGFIPPAVYEQVEEAPPVDVR